jgi:hypothetical protein
LAISLPRLHLAVAGADCKVMRRTGRTAGKGFCAERACDEQLKPKLSTEVRGIFHWMLHGLADYLKNGTIPAEGRSCHLSVSRIPET